MNEFGKIFLESGFLAASALSVYLTGTLLHPMIGHLASALGMGILSLVIGVLLIDLMDGMFHSFSRRPSSG